jgi:hypothetical protein
MARGPHSVTNSGSKRANTDYSINEACQSRPPEGRSSARTAPVQRGRDLAWLGVVMCLRRSGMGIADLRRFVGVLRDGAPASTDPVEMLRLHRKRLVEDIDLRVLGYS